MTSNKFGIIEIFLELFYFCYLDRSMWMTAPTISGYTHPSSWIEPTDTGQVLLPHSILFSHAFVYCWLRCTANENNWGQMQCCAPSADGRRLLFCQEQLFIIVLLSYKHLWVIGNLRSKIKKSWLNEAIFLYVITINLLVMKTVISIKQTIIFITEGQ